MEPEPVNREVQRNMEKVLQMAETNNQKTDYTYFNDKMLENWAGPAHWKFKTNKGISDRY